MFESPERANGSLGRAMGSGPYQAAPPFPHESGSGRVGYGALMPETTVVHNQRDDYDQYIGRTVPEAGLEASKWGNPFVMADESDAERERVIRAYREWIVEQPELMQSIGELRGLRLGCWCAPKRCHGEVLAELAEKY